MTTGLIEYLDGQLEGMEDGPDAIFLRDMLTIAQAHAGLTEPAPETVARRLNLRPFDIPINTLGMPHTTEQAFSHNGLTTVSRILAVKDVVVGHYVAIPGIGTTHTSTALGAITHLQHSRNFLDGSTVKARARHRAEIDTYRRFDILNRSIRFHLVARFGVTTMSDLKRRAPDEAVDWIKSYRLAHLHRRDVEAENFLRGLYLNGDH